MTARTKAYIIRKSNASVDSEYSYNKYLGRRYIFVLVALLMVLMMQLHANTERITENFLPLDKISFDSGATNVEPLSSNPAVPSPMATSNTDPSKSFKLPEACKSEPNCRNRFAPKVGYSRVAFDGFIGELVCPSMFRDLTDYVINWPFAHFEEDVYFAKSLSAAKKCLAPVPLIYWQTVS